MSVIRLDVRQSTRGYKTTEEHVCGFYESEKNKRMYRAFNSVRPVCGFWFAERDQTRFGDVGLTATTVF